MRIKGEKAEDFKEFIKHKQYWLKRPVNWKKRYILYARIDGPIVAWPIIWYEMLYSRDLHTEREVIRSDYYIEKIEIKEPVILDLTRWPKKRYRKITGSYVRKYFASWL